MRNLLWIILSSYAGSIIYFGLFNGIAYAWVPLALILVLIVYRTLGFKTALWSALMSGIMLDLHSLYVGPSILLLIAPVIVAEVVYNRFANMQSLRTTIACLAAACVAFFIVRLVVGQFLFGISVFQNHSMIIPESLYAMLLTLVVVLIAEVIARTVRNFSPKYGR